MLCVGLILNPPHPQRDLVLPIWVVCLSHSTPSVASWQHSTPHSETPHKLEVFSLYIPCPIAASTGPSKYPTKSPCVYIFPLPYCSVHKAFQIYTPALLQRPQGLPNMCVYGIEFSHPTNTQDIMRQQIINYYSNMQYISTSMGSYQAILF